MDFILNFFYPNVCCFCHRITKEAICKKCEIKLNSIAKNQIICNDSKKEIYFDYHIYLFDYKEEIREKIISYKFKEQSYLYKGFAKIITKNEKICGFLKKYDIIIPVPIHEKRKRVRGYNQSELIVKEIVKSIKELKIDTTSLKKIKNNPKQSVQNKHERKTNVKNVYEIKNQQTIKNKKIILFDDIYTTGNTVNECSRLLKKAGAKQISVLTIAKD